MPWKLTPEEVLQIAVCKYLRLALPSGAVVRSIDHGVYMNETRRQILHARGVRAGLPDIMIFWCSRLAQIELKVRPNGQSDHQREHQAVMLANGFHYACCYSLEDVEQALRSDGWPLRAVVQAPVTASPKPSRASRPPRERADHARIRRVEKIRAKVLF